MTLTRVETLQADVYQLDDPTEENPDGEIRGQLFDERPEATPPPEPPS